MKNHPFTLEPYKGMNSRYKCPDCHKERSFTRYIDSATGEHLHPTVGSLNNLNAGMCEVLSGRTVILFPDLNGSEKWKSKAEDLSNLALFIVSDLLERKANKDEKYEGLDLADCLIKYDHKEFALLQPGFAPLPCPPTITAFTNENQYTFIRLNHNKAQNESLSEAWNHEIKELETYFNQITLPDHPIKLNPWTTIEDASLFIQRHLETVKANNGKITFLPYLQRLQELKQLLD